MTGMDKKIIGIIIVFSLIVIGVAAASFYMGKKYGETIAKTTTTTPLPLNEAIKKIFQPDLEKAMKSSKHLMYLSDTLSFDNLEENKYYVFCDAGLKLYNGTDPYGLTGALKYPGYFINGLTLIQPYKKFVLIINVSTNGISDYMMEIVLVNTQTGEQFSYGILHNRTTIAYINITNPNDYGNYKIYLYGWIKTSSTKASISYNIDLRAWTEKQ